MLVVLVVRRVHLFQRRDLRLALDAVVRADVRVGDLQKDPRLQMSPLQSKKKEKKSEFA